MLLPQRLALLLCAYLVAAQPSPEQQKRIVAAIQDAAHNPNPDYTAFVNPFIGTGEPFVAMYHTKHLIFVFQIILVTSCKSSRVVSMLRIHVFSPGASIPFGMVRPVEPICLALLIRVF